LSNSLRIPPVQSCSGHSGDDSNRAGIEIDMPFGVYGELVGLGLEQQQGTNGERKFRCLTNGLRLQGELSQSIHLELAWKKKVSPSSYATS